MRARSARRGARRLGGQVQYFLLSLSSEATINVQSSARHVSGLLARQEINRLGALLHRTHPAQRNVARELVAELLDGLPHPRRMRHGAALRKYWARRHAVRADAEAAVVERYVAHHLLQSRLRGRVGHEAREREVRCDRRGQHDAAAAHCAEDWYDLFNAQGGARNVDGANSRPLRGRHMVHLAVLKRGGHDHERAEAARKMRERGSKSALYRILGAYVYLKKGGARAQFGCERTPT